MTADGRVPWRWATPVTPGRAHFGAKMGILSAAMGRPHMPHQRHICQVASEIDPDTGDWAYQTIVVTIQRQAGKTSVVIPANLHECMRVPDSYCWYTAQTRQAARDNFLKDAKPLLRSKLSPLLKLRRSNGSEGIEVKANGSEYRVFTAGTEELHGKTNRRVTVDEAWAYGALEGIELMQSIIPTFTTTAGQLWIMSTAGTAESAFLLDWIAKGRAAVERGDRRGIAHFECAIPPDADPADLRTDGAKRDAFIRMVLDNHPANGHTLKVAALHAALSQMDPSEFARAYGNFWTPTTETLIGLSDYTACLDMRDDDELPAAPKGRVAYGFDVGADDADAAIVAAWYDPVPPWAPPGRLRVEVLDHRPGIGWLAGRLDSLERAWHPLAIGFNDHGPASVAADVARRAGITLHGLTGQAYATACAGFKTAVNQNGLAIVANPGLDDAIPVLARRPLGDAWVWCRKGSAGSITTVVAATCAIWTLQHAPPPFTIR